MISRRNFIKLSGGAVAVGALAGCAGGASRGAGGKVVVVGGGPGGATAAKYLRMVDPSIEVTLIEANTKYYTCFMSNEVLGGDRNLDSITFGYDGLRRHGVRVVHDTVTQIDAAARKIVTKGGQTFSYDRAIVSPGIDFKWAAVEGLSAEVAETAIPHAWKAGAQTVTLHKQLLDMKNGGTVVIATPSGAFRCPPGPYERASLIANYLKKHKPKSKVLILDAGDKFAKQGLFMAGWKKHYGHGTANSMIEWVPAAQGGKVEGVDAKAMTVQAAVEKIKADVINIIPPQKAGKLAFDAGLTEGDWCPINKKTFESKIHPNIHVLGDASNSAGMPKSGYSANVQAKVCAMAVADLMAGREPGFPSYMNTCYSIIADDHGISISIVYTFDEAKNEIIAVKGAGGVTPSDATAEALRREAHYAHGWFANITNDIFG